MLLATALLATALLAAALAAVTLPDAGAADDAAGAVAAAAPRWPPVVHATRLVPQIAAQTISALRRTARGWPAI